MKKDTVKTLLISLGISLVITALGFLSTSSVPARAGDDDEERRQHELEPQLASDTVTLQTTNFFSAPCFQNNGATIAWTFDRSLVKSGGTFIPFTLPAGKVLVVTSLDWTASGSAAAANKARIATLWRAIAGNKNGPSAQSTAIADSNGRAGGSETFPSGIVLQNPGQFCLGVDIDTTPVPGEFIFGVLQGFLAPDK